MEAVLTYKDKNHAVAAPVFNFWPQQQINNTWTAYPTNLKEISKDMEFFAKWAKTILEMLHLEHLWEEISGTLKEVE